jgi:uncharacterized membrane protein YuzA (DUF378 family)
MFHNKLYVVASVIAAVGAVNWGLVGAFHFDVVMWLGDLIKHPDEFARVAHVVIGLCGVYSLFEVLRCCSHCETKK